MIVDKLCAGISICVLSPASFYFIEFYLGAQLPVMLFSGVVYFFVSQYMGGYKYLSEDFVARQLIL